MLPTQNDTSVPVAYQDTLGGWSLILNNIDVTYPLPYEISPGIRLDRASDERICTIKNRLQLLLGDGQPGWARFFEYAFEKSTENTNSVIMHPLPPDHWRYYIIEFDDNGKLNIDLHLASNASLMPIENCSIRIMNNGGFAWKIGALQNYFSGMEWEWGPPKIIEKTELLDLAEAYHQYIHTTGGIGGNSDFPEILRALDLLDSLSLIPYNSDFHILGLFAIIEMLITHNPKLEDRGDSITHQMQSKIPLLSKRFTHKISPEKFFENTSEKKIWSALYKFRSIIAHGGVADFSSGDLQCLKNAQTAKTFLLDVVRKMIRHTFSEPVLYRDLRAC